MNIALIGACEMEGAAVAKAFKQAKCEPTLVVEDVLQAQQLLGNEYKYKRCELGSLSMLKNTLLGMESVYISLTCSDECSAQLMVGYIKNIVAACQFCNVKTIGLLSQSFVSEQNTGLFYETHAQYECEQLLRESALNYLIFCPAPFMENVPQYVQGRQLHNYIKSERAIHWLALKDFACAVVKTYQHGGIENARFILQGQSAFSLQEAINIYAQEVYRGIKFENVESFISWLRVSFMVDKRLLHGAKQARFLAQAQPVKDDNSEQGHWLLPSVTTAFKAWCHLQVLVKRQDQTALSA